MQLECSATLIYRANSRAVTMLKSSEPGKIVTDLFQAYFDTRKNKRSTLNALAFEKHFESNIFELADEIMENRYVIKPSMCFVEELTFQLDWFKQQIFGTKSERFVDDYDMLVALELDIVNKGDPMCWQCAGPPSA